MRTAYLQALLSGDGRALPGAAELACRLYPGSADPAGDLVAVASARQNELVVLTHTVLRLEPQGRGEKAWEQLLAHTPAHRAAVLLLVSTFLTYQAARIDPLSLV